MGRHCKDDFPNCLEFIRLTRRIRNLAYRLSLVRKQRMKLRDRLRKRKQRGRPNPKAFDIETALYRGREYDNVVFR